MQKLKREQSSNAYFDGASLFFISVWDVERFSLTSSQLASVQPAESSRGRHRERGKKRARSKLAKPTKPAACLPGKRATRSQARPSDHGPLGGGARLAGPNDERSDSSVLLAAVFCPPVPAGIDRACHYCYISGNSKPRAQPQAPGSELTRRDPTGTLAVRKGLFVWETVTVIQSARVCRVFEEREKCSSRKTEGNFSDLFLNYWDMEG